MLKLIEILSKKPRVTGSKRNKEICNFLSKELKKLGYKARIQKVNFTGWQLIKKPLLTINNKKIKCLPVIWSGSGNVNGKLIKTSKIKTFEAYEWLRWKVVDKGKVKGYIISRPDIVWLQPFKSKLPYFMIYPKECKKLMKNCNVNVKGTVKSKLVKGLKIQNIVTKNNSKNKIIICAHYDSILNSPGANDNASGVAALLELAKKFKDKKVQFILFDAEEWDKYGSYAYVKSLNKNQLKQIKAVINIDMVGHGNPYVICSKKFNSIVRKSINKSKNKKIKIVSNKVLKSSDEWPFNKKGIPIIRFGATPYNYCHDPKDTIDKISLKPIKQVIKIAEEIVKEL